MKTSVEDDKPLDQKDLWIKDNFWKELKLKEHKSNSLNIEA